ncbi:MAG: T9SS type A sorting domain-containing protein [Bacteroidetes bacterium]|nr:T9SS type A sorting domain-containing protein [Bacteroidota bacterium]
MYTRLIFFFFTAYTAALNAQNQLWAMTNEGGQNGLGTIFNTDAGGNNQNTLYSFAQTDGAKPLYTDFIQANNGLLYGVTYRGGAKDIGVFFEYNPLTLNYTKKFDFDSANGSKPLGSLIQASDGMLYGMTLKGGANDKGVLFQYNPSSSAYSKKFDFSLNDGCYPHGTLLQLNDSLLYGMTSQGGANNKGVIFQYNLLTSVCTKKFDFDSIRGSYPLGSLMKAGDGMLYGMSSGGGTYNLGVLFQFDPISAGCAKKFEFSGPADGSTPLGFLLQASDGKLYGMTNHGGLYDKGVLFQFDYNNNAFTKKLDFDSIHGSYPFGSLLQAGNQMLYGMTRLGGAYDSGVLFQFDPVSGTLTKKLDFNITNGAHPYGNLIQVNPQLAGISNASETGNAITIFPNPCHGSFSIHGAQAGLYAITNMLDQTVLSFDIKAGEIKNIDGLEDGLYFITDQRTHKLFQKIVVVR